MSTAASTVSPSSGEYSNERFERFATFSLIAGIIGLLIALFMLILDPAMHEGGPAATRASKSWLIGYAFWLAILVGGLFWIMITYLFDSSWSAIVRRQWEHLMSAWKYMIYLLLPVIFIPWILGDPLWEWFDTSEALPGGSGATIAEDPVYQHKSAYLNPIFFLVRMGIYLTVFVGLAHFLRKFSIQNDDHPDVENYAKARRVSGLGIFLAPLATTFIAIDLFMTLAFHWFSTMYGVWFFSVALRASLAFTVLACNYFAWKGGLQNIFGRPHNYFLGCLMLAFTIFWAYISFSQYFLIYNANIPEETFWYTMRFWEGEDGLASYWYVGWALIVGYFLIPFFLLLIYRNKVVTWRINAIAAYILIFTLLDIYFNVLPTKQVVGEGGKYVVNPFLPTIIDFCAIIGMGGIVMWAFFKSVASHLPIPVNDPFIADSIHCSE